MDVCTTRTDDPSCMYRDCLKLCLYSMSRYPWTGHVEQPHHGCQIDMLTTRNGKLTHTRVCLCSISDGKENGPPQGSQALFNNDMNTWESIWPSVTIRLWGNQMYSSGPSQVQRVWPCLDETTEPSPRVTVDNHNPWLIALIFHCMHNCPHTKSDVHFWGCCCAIP